MLRKITQDFKLVGQERAPLKKWSFVKSQVLQILNLKYVRRFLRKFYWKNPNIKWKLQAVLEFSTAESDRNTPFF